MASRSVRLQIVKVTWVDAHTHSAGWIDEEEFQAWMDDPGIMVSVGTMLYRDKKWLAMAMSVGPDTVADCLKIPIGMVLRVEKLGQVTMKDMESPSRGGKKKCPDQKQRGRSA